MLNKKHYTAIADIIKRFNEENLKNEGRFNGTQFLIDEFAYWLEKDANFDEKKFLENILTTN